MWQLYLYCWCCHSSSLLFTPSSRIFSTTIFSTIFPFKNPAQCDLNCQFSKNKLLEAVQEIVLSKSIERKLDSSDRLLQIVDFPDSGIHQLQVTQGMGWLPYIHSRSQFCWWYVPSFRWLHLIIIQEVANYKICPCNQSCWNSICSEIKISQHAFVLTLFGFEHFWL